MTAKRIRIEFNVDTINYASAVDDMIYEIKNAVYNNDVYHPMDPDDPDTDYIKFTSEVIEEFPSPGEEARNRERAEAEAEKAHSERWERAEGLYRSKMELSPEQFRDFATNIAEEMNLVTIWAKPLYMISDKNKTIMYGMTDTSGRVCKYHNTGIVVNYNGVNQYVWKEIPM